MKDGVLKGILWHQGESDSRAGPAEVYEKKLHDLISRFRKELNAPEVPFIAGQMGQFVERPWSDAKKLVDTAHRSLPEKVKETASAAILGSTIPGSILAISCVSIMGEWAEGTS